ncbi:hypothetical protein BSL78_20497 [Apostichopus japonicus]|uniref:Uncharacterized protein n=1 Tax=Stichopus japonicus TaxID=307972 RepID=A0A2G8K3V8_STIJA|nr:hypothetical protein BSL78_20497 [Apostichopus japonicus]
MAHQQGTATVTTVYNTPYPVANQAVQVRRVEITFNAADVTACKLNGFFQVAVGILCLIFGIVAICIECYYGEEAVALWCGIWFIFAGFCGMSVGRYQGYMAQKSLMRYMWLSSISTSFAIVLIVFMSMSVAWEPYIISPYYYVPPRRTRLAIDATILTLACLEFLAALHGSCIARKTSNRADRKTTVSTQPGVTAVPAINGYPAAQTNVAFSAYPPSYDQSQAYPPVPPQGYSQQQYGFAQPQPGPATTVPQQQYGFSQPQPQMAPAVPSGYASAESKPTI